MPVSQDSGTTGAEAPGGTGRRLLDVLNCGQGPFALHSLRACSQYYPRVHDRESVFPPTGRRHPNRCSDPADVQHMPVAQVLNGSGSRTAQYGSCVHSSRSHASFRLPSNVFATSAGRQRRERPTRLISRHRRRIDDCYICVSHDIGVRISSATDLRRASGSALLTGLQLDRLRVCGRSAFSVHSFDAQQMCIETARRSLWREETGNETRRAARDAFPVTKGKAPAALGKMKTFVQNGQNVKIRGPHEG